MWVSDTPPLGIQRSEHQASEALRSAKRNPSHQPSASLAFVVNRGALVGRAIPEIEASSRIRSKRCEEEPTPLPSRCRRRTGEALPLADFRGFLTICEICEYASPLGHFVAR